MRWSSVSDELLSSLMLTICAHAILFLAWSCLLAAHLCIWFINIRDVWLPQLIVQSLVLCDLPLKRILCYAMLKCLHICVSSHTNLFGDSFGVIKLQLFLKVKKHVAIFYHYVWEASTKLFMLSGFKVMRNWVIFALRPWARTSFKIFCPWCYVLTVFACAWEEVLF